MVSIVEKHHSVFLVGKSFEGANVSNLEFDQHWVALKENYEYRLHEGDIFKLGKIEYKIIEVSGRDDAPYNDLPVESKKLNTVGIHGLPGTNLRSVKAVERKPDSNPDACRICFEHRQKEKNPLISICNCTGSVKFIHLNCLKQWLKTK